MTNAETIAALENQGYDVRVLHDRAFIKGKPRDKGGRTVVFIRYSDGLTAAKGEAVCSSKDNYNRKLGLTIALGRAMKELEQTKIGMVA